MKSNNKKIKEINGYMIFFWHEKDWEVYDGCFTNKKEALKALNNAKREEPEIEFVLAKEKTSYIIIK